MIATHPQTAKPQGINIGLDEHGQIQSINVGFELTVGHRHFSESVTWHDGRGVSVTRADPSWLKMLNLVVEKIIEDTRNRIEP